MTCQAIISAPPATLSKSQTVEQALGVLLTHRASMLPVVDAKGQFAGIFGLKEVVALLLPRAARLGEDMGDLGFLSDSLHDLRQRLVTQGKENVGKHLAAHRTIRPETPLVEALLLLYRGDSFLPVVDEAGKLIGVLNAADALTRMAEAQ
jgi:CBS-domain-containing membrane protein